MGTLNYLLKEPMILLEIGLDIQLILKENVSAFTYLNFDHQKLPPFYFLTKKKRKNFFPYF